MKQGGRKLGKGGGGGAKGETKKEKEKSYGENRTGKEIGRGKARTCNQRHQGPHPNQVPAIQAEQVADDVAPVMEEYVPAKASHEDDG